MQLTNEQLREKYLKMAKSTGMDEAITAVHREIGSMEPRVFDGGYDKARFTRLEFLRTVARELYTLKLTEASKFYYEGKK